MFITKLYGFLRLEWLPPGVAFHETVNRENELTQRTDHKESRNLQLNLRQAIRVLASFEVPEYTIYTIHSKYSTRHLMMINGP